MSKTETLRQSAAASNAMQLDLLTQQIEALRRARIKSADELAQGLEPIAQAMAALIDQTAKTLDETASTMKLVDRRAELTATEFEERIERAATTFEARMTTSISAWTEATKEAQGTLKVLQQATTRLQLPHYLITIMTGILAALLVSAFLRWGSPTPVIQLDAAETRALLKADPKGSATAQPRPSPGK